MPAHGNAVCQILQSQGLDPARGMQIKSAIDDALEWLEDNQEAEQEEYEEKLKDMQDKVQPIVAGAYGAAGEGGGEDDDDLGDHDEL